MLKIAANKHHVEIMYLMKNIFDTTNNNNIKRKRLKLKRSGR